MHLRLVNESNGGNQQIVLFQKNVATGFDELAVAWRVIQNLSPGWSNSFTYSSQVQVQVTDSWGNTSQPLDLANGQMAEVVMGSCGTELRLSSRSAANTEEIQIGNYLQQGAIHVTVLRDGLPAARKTDIAPGQKAVFSFRPSIFIGVVSQVEAGQVVDSAIMTDVNTEISLLGIQSADIVMSGGGAGPSARPFTFALQNVVLA
ncbi:hypothetical protein K8638_26810 [Myxococcus sp. RHST-1-4]|nr:hypothetical protein [Myxococcus sp. RHSTA-1-4]